VDILNFFEQLFYEALSAEGSAFHISLLIVWLAGSDIITLSPLKIK
jgi:hypothetical protein